MYISVANKSKTPVKAYMIELEQFFKDVYGRITSHTYVDSPCVSDSSLDNLYMQIIASELENGTIEREDADKFIRDWTFLPESKAKVISRLQNEFSKAVYFRTGIKAYRNLTSESRSIDINNLLALKWTLVRAVQIIGLKSITTDISKSSDTQKLISSNLLCQQLSMILNMQCPCKQCLVCYRPFESTDSRQRYCGVDCQTSAQNFNRKYKQKIYDDKNRLKKSYSDIEKAQLFYAELQNIFDEFVTLANAGKLPEMIGAND